MYAFRLRKAYIGIKKGKLLMDVRKYYREAEPYIIERRRWYHQHPTLSWDEKETRDQIHRDLEAIGITEITDYQTCYGLVATIRGGKRGRTVGLRTDIDALPIEEMTGLPFASERPGAMHACGHDAHIAMLLGAAKILYEHRDELAGDVRLIVQPAEERVEGAKAMIAEGCLEGVDAIYGQHVWPSCDKGMVDITSGVRMMYVGTYDIYIDGVMAHGAYPNLGKDAIVAGCAVVMALQQYVSRINFPLDPLVLNIGNFEGGPRYNIVPNKVHMIGTLRASKPDNHVEIMTNIIENVAKGYGCTGRLEYVHNVGPVVNDEGLVKLAQASQTKLFGAETIVHPVVNLASDDFACYGEHIPAIYTFLGTGDAAAGYIHSVHQERFDLPEDVLKNGTALMAQFAADWLEENK